MKTYSFATLIANAIALAMILAAFAWPDTRLFTLITAPIGTWRLAICQFTIRAENLRRERAAA